MCTIGISQFAIEQLTDIVYVELPHVGDHIFAGQGFGEIESVKSVNDLYAPLSGEVSAVNEAVVNDPSIISTDPYGKGWMIKIEVEPGRSSTSCSTRNNTQNRWRPRDIEFRRLRLDARNIHQNVPKPQ